MEAISWCFFALKLTIDGGRWPYMAVAEKEVEEEEDDRKRVVKDSGVAVAAGLGEKTRREGGREGGRERRVIEREGEEEE